MNQAVERLLRGQELIESGKSQGKDVRVLEEQVSKLQNFLQLELEKLKLSEFEGHGLAVLVHSEVLGEDVWLVSDRAMAAQVARDAPGSVFYTAGELGHLVSLNPGPEGLKNIHKLRRVFPDSAISKSKPKEAPEVLERLMDNSTGKDKGE